jgi:hypothetical protein
MAWLASGGVNVGFSHCMPGMFDVLRQAVIAMIAAGAANESMVFSIKNRFSGERRSEARKNLFMFEIARILGISGLISKGNHLELGISQFACRFWSIRQCQSLPATCALLRDSARRALDKFAQRARNTQNWPRRDCYDDGEKERFNGKLHLPFEREIRSRHLAK